VLVFVAVPVGVEVPPALSSQAANETAIELRAKMPRPTNRFIAITKITFPKYDSSPCRYAGSAEVEFSWDAIRGKRLEGSS
jgi:hypothetical protein